MISVIPTPDTEPMTLEERFWNKVDAEGDCWLWTGGQNGTGHGHFNFTENGVRRLIIASRFAWQVLVGPIPEGLEMDHLCRNPPCVNPDHLEPVTHRENMLRGFAPTMRAFKNSLPGKCPNGHSWIDNTRFNQRGVRECSACNVERVRANRQAKRAAAALNTKETT